MSRILNFPTLKVDFAVYIPRRTKASRKRRGTRTCGWGKVGQHRKSGGKGGVGHAGMHKHKWSLTLKYEREHFGKKGFKRPRNLITHNVEINVGQLDELAERLALEGLLELHEGKPLLDGSKLDFSKVLGRGRVTKALVVKAPFVTKKAKEKIEASGGMII